MGHYQFSVVITSQFCQEKPLEPQVQALSMHQLFKGLGREDGVGLLQSPGNALDRVHKDQLEWVLILMVYQSVLQLEISCTVTSY